MFFSFQYREETFKYEAQAEALDGLIKSIISCLSYIRPLAVPLVRLIRDSVEFNFCINL